MRVVFWRLSRTESRTRHVKLSTRCVYYRCYTGSNETVHWFHICLVTGESALRDTVTSCHLASNPTMLLLLEVNLLRVLGEKHSCAAAF